MASLALFSVSLAMVLTNSRNAIGSLIFGSLGMIAGIFSASHSIGGFRVSRFSIALFVIAVVSFFSFCLGFVNPALVALSQFFADEQRLEIWRFGVLIASSNFLVGSGPGGFTGYVSLLSPFDQAVYHVHSLPLDLWVSYGFVAFAVFLVYVFAWLFAAVRSGMLRESIFSKAWIIAFVLLIIFHATDLPYLDARINLVGWILFGGIVSSVESSALASSEPSE